MNLPSISQASTAVGEQWEPLEVFHYARRMRVKWKRGSGLALTLTHRQIDNLPTDCVRHPPVFLSWIQDVTTTPQQLLRSRGIYHQTPWKVTTAPTCTQCCALVPLCIAPRLCPLINQNAVAGCSHIVHLCRGNIIWIFHNLCDGVLHKEWQAAFLKVFFWESVCRMIYVQGLTPGSFHLYVQTGEIKSWLS